MKSSNTHTPEIRPESPKGAGKFLKSTILATTALSLGMGFGGAAFAQEATADAGTDAADIVVTARRVEERLQDVPISITVFNQDQLDQANVVNAQDLAAITPSLAVDNRFGSDNATFAIRGFTQELRTTQTVATYFADVVGPRTGSTLIDGVGPGALYDLQNVQVLKGPQGTLFGRNTTGGAVLLVPQRPTDEFGGYLEGSLGDYNLERVQGVLNVPISETLRARFGVDQQKRDGTLHINGGYPTDDLNDVNYISGRASLVWDITPSLENYTILSYTNSDTQPGGAQIIGCNPAAAQIPPGDFFHGGLGGAETYNAGCYAQLAGQGFHDYAQNSVPHPENQTWAGQLINTTTWSASDNLTVKNIFSYSETEAHTRSPVFGTNFMSTGCYPDSSDHTPPTGSCLANFPQLPWSFSSAGERPGQPSASENTMTEELQLQGTNLGDRLKWQAGLYYEHSYPGETSGGRSLYATSCEPGSLNGDPSEFSCVNDPALGLAGLLGGVEDVQSWVRYTNMALYTQASFDITDRLTATAGYRYTWDKTSYWTQNVLYGFTPGFSYGGYSTAPITPLTSVGLFMDYTRCSSPVDGAYNAADPNTCTSSGIQRSEAPTWLLGLDYQLTDDNMVYAKYARGYRQGSIIPLGISGLNTFGPESVDNYEIGSKNSFRGAFPGVFNIAAFYTDFRKQQLQLGLFPISGVSTTAIFNTNSSTVWGIELDGSVELFTGFRLSGGYTYLHSNVDDTNFPDIPTLGDPDALLLQGGVPNAIEGQPLPNSPQNRATITAAYTLPTPETVGEVTVSATYNVSSHYQTCGITVGSPLCGVDGYETVNLNLDWNKVGGSNVDVSAFVTNLFDEEYVTFVSGTYGAGFESGAVGDPQMAGVRVRYSFGGEAS